MSEENKGQIILYQTEDGQTRLEVQLQGETVWLSLDQMAELFQHQTLSMLESHYLLYEETIENEKSKS